MSAPGLWGAEFLVNAVTENAQMNPVITGLADGRFAIAYTDFSESSREGFTDHSDSAIRVQVFNSNGSACSAAIQVNTVTNFYQQSPQIAPLADGGFVVTYSDLSVGWDSGGDDIWAEAVRMQRFTGDGCKLGAETLVNSTVVGDQDFPSIARLETGQFLVAWDNGYDDIDVNIAGQIFNPDGSRAGGELMLNAGTAGIQCDSDIAALPGGGFVATWVDTTGVDGEGGTIMARMFGPDGTPLGPEWQINTTAVSDQFQPSITALAGGGFFIAWADNSRGAETRGDDTSSYAVRGQVLDASGAWVGGEILVNHVTTYGQYQPNVLALSDGRFIVAFCDTSSGTETGGDDLQYGAIRARIFNADGSPCGEEFLVNTTTTGHQNEPQMAQLPDGRVVFTWTDYSYGAETGGDDSDNGAIRSRILDIRESAVSWTGRSAAEQFTGTIWNDRLNGGAGRDTLMGRQGADLLCGNAGDDLVLGGNGADRLYGHRGRDRLEGGNGPDVIHGGKGWDKLFGQKGHDKLFGNMGNDQLFGNRGNDMLFGHKGCDRLNGGRGRDVLNGGQGDDVFVFNSRFDSGPSAAARDRITDFGRGNNRIDLSAIDADPTAPGNDAFTFLGQAGFNGQPGGLRYLHTDGKTIVQVDLDGDRAADMAIELTGTHTLTAEDFIL